MISDAINELKILGHFGTQKTFRIDRFLQSARWQPSIFFNRGGQRPPEIVQQVLRLLPAFHAHVLARVRFHRAFIFAHAGHLHAHAQFLHRAGKKHGLRR